MGWKGDKLKTNKLQYPGQEVLATSMARNDEKPYDVRRKSKIEK